VQKNKSLESAIHNHLDNHLDNPNDYHNNSNTETKKYYCHKCKKCFNTYQNRWRHEKKCNYEKNSEDKIIEENSELKIIIKQQTEIINEMKEKQSEELKQMKSILNELLGFYETMSLCE